MLSPSEYYKYLSLARKGYHTGYEDELQQQAQTPRSLGDTLAWKAQAKMERRKFPKDYEIGSARKKEYI